MIPLPEEEEKDALVLCGRLPAGPARPFVEAPSRVSKWKFLLLRGIGRTGGRAVPLQDPAS